MTVAAVACVRMQGAVGAGCKGGQCSSAGNAGCTHKGTGGGTILTLPPPFHTPPPPLTLHRAEHHAPQVVQGGAALRRVLALGLPRRKCGQHLLLLLGGACGGAAVLVPALELQREVLVEAEGQAVPCSSGGGNKGAGAVMQLSWVGAARC